MAATPKPLVSVGDFVNVTNRLCYIESVENTLGFNQYVCVDMDEPGRRYIKSRHEIEIAELGFLDSLLFDQSLEAEVLIPKTEEKAKKPTKRFAQVTEEDLDDFALNKSSKRTREQTSWGVAIFKEYLEEAGFQTNFEEFTNENLAQHLRRLYGALRSKKQKNYSKSSYINIRAAINRYLTSPPYNRKLNIVHDREFMSANQVLIGILRKMLEEGKDTTQHKCAIPEGDMQKMYQSGTLSNDTPKSLQRKIFVEISINFGRRGRKGLRELKKESIVIKKDDQGNEYATLAYNELDKTHQISAPKEVDKKQLMYVQEGPLCPILSLKKYLAKLNPKCSSFFQRARTLKNPQDHDIWYENKSLGIHTIEKFMRDISKDAELSETYTNHCLRATTSTILSHAGVETRNICSVTGHKNFQSLESYIQQPSMQQRQEMCNILHKYGKENNTRSTALVPRTTCTVTRATENVPTTSQSNMAIPDSGDGEYIVRKPLSATQNIKTESLFSGAQFLGTTTINVMIHKQNE